MRIDKSGYTSLLAGHNEIKREKRFFSNLWVNFLKPFLDVILSVITLSAWYFLVVRKRNESAMSTNSNVGSESNVDREFERLPTRDEAREQLKTELMDSMLERVEETSRDQFAKDVELAFQNKSVSDYLLHTQFKAIDDAVAEIKNFRVIYNLFEISINPAGINSVAIENRSVISLMKAYREIESRGGLARLNDESMVDYNNRLKEQIVGDAMNNMRKVPVKHPHQ